MQKNIAQLKYLHYICTMKIKIILFAVLLACALVICWLSAELSRANKHIADAENLIEIQHEMIIKLGALDAVNATINVEVTNKATFGSINSGDVQIVADQILHYTRKQLLNDSTTWN